MNDPFRQPATIVPLREDVRIVELRLAGALPFTPDLDGQWRACPKCATRYDGTEGPTLRRAVCVGRWHWWWPFGCRIRAEHFHMHCRSCKARWIMAPADVKLTA